MRDLCIAVAGNQWITEYLIIKLCKVGYKPSLIINMSDDKSSNISGYVDLSRVAVENDIEIIRPTKYALNSDEDIEKLGEYNIDILLVFGWQRLIPKWLIEQCKIGVYGVHGGPEKPPRCRGQAVFNWAMIMNYTHFYMYMFKITPEVDSGDILDICEFDLLENDDIQSVYDKNCVVSTNMMIKNLNAIADGSVTSIKQVDTNATYLPKRRPEDGEIHWDDTAINICNLVRAVTRPYPGAFSRIDGELIYIYRAQIFDTKVSFVGEPGQIVDVFPDGCFVVNTKDYPIYVRDYLINSKLDIGSKFEYEKNSIPDFPVV